MTSLVKRKNLVLGKGFIGSYLAKHLRDSGEEVRVLARDGGVDLRQAENQQASFEWADRVWFVAWDVGVWKKDTPPSYEADILESNLQLCRSVFRVLEKTKKPFLFVSSQASLFPDLMTLGVTKKVGELWTKILGGQIARFWNVYGWEPVGEKSHLIPDLVWNGLQGEKIQLRSSGEETRQFVYVQDAVEALVYQFDSGQEVAEIVSGTWTPVREVARLVGEKLGVGVVLGEQAGKPSLATPSTPLLGWLPRFSLEQGVEETIKEAKSLS
ncbi:MAG: hypothetical protein COU11_01360 [Candidatus Harrisonbacteria bacterium CG10_big_fil_rev_8_21_14_0_10_49_15]|uniref:NAD-dependent epimerase/dehydratase domain-containing protein n=1 Tax=Candidatus Harrisonbacteria bacterium CG10_big_fil_rev_8_21_14_0_10_49_15 TaxID=1974587 RepID=A0A2H0ULI8_9BACT|nr:MAG: hypothetical protein COU11_01360 [Candidatus Harrisonbacteria bacterium CG10_big_fil_rev_8_21_14_0_10_49_15]